MTVSRRLGDRLQSPLALAQEPPACRVQSRISREVPDVGQASECGSGSRALTKSAKNVGRAGRRTGQPPRRQDATQRFAMVPGSRCAAHGGVQDRPDDAGCRRDCEVGCRQAAAVEGLGGFVGSLSMPRPAITAARPCRHVHVRSPDKSAAGGRRLSDGNTRFGP
jgi:hypothetical protein